MGISCLGKTLKAVSLSGDLVKVQRIVLFLATLCEIWGWGEQGKGLVCFDFFFFFGCLFWWVFREHFLCSQRCSDWEQPAGGSRETACAHYLPSALREGSSESHTKHPHMHIGLSDLLRRPGQWCFKSSTTLGSPLSPNCSDRIGSEMCVGLKIGLLFWHELNNLVFYVSPKNGLEQRSHFMDHFWTIVCFTSSLCILKSYLYLTLPCCNTLIVRWDCCAVMENISNLYFLTRIVRGLFNITHNRNLTQQKN